MGLEETWGVVDARVMSRLIVRDPRGLKKVIKDMKSRGRRQKQAGRRVEHVRKKGHVMCQPDRPPACLRETHTQSRQMTCVVSTSCYAIAFHPRAYLHSPKPKSTNEASDGFIAFQTKSLRLCVT